MTTGLTVTSSVITSIGSITNMHVVGGSTTAMGENKYLITFSCFENKASFEAGDSELYATFKNNRPLPKQVVVTITVEPSRTTVLQALKEYLEDDSKEFDWTVTEVTE